MSKPCQGGPISVPSNDSYFHLAGIHAVLKILRVVVLERTFGAFRIRIDEVPEQLGCRRRKLRIPAVLNAIQFISQAPNISPAGLRNHLGN